MNVFQREKHLLAQTKELKQLREELVKLRAQNESMRAGMRRCITCDYRLEAKARNGEADV
jgi:uncharacterized protein with PIN domain